MVDQAAIQRHVAFGLGKAASKLGAAFGQFRPGVSVNNPLDPANKIADLNANFDQTPAFKFAGPAPYAKEIRFGLLDTTDVAAGDYFVSDAGLAQTLFLGRFAPFEPPLCVLCNRVLTFKRDAHPVVVGPQPGYVGPTEATDVTLATGWPASVLLGTKGESNPVSGRLAADTRAGWWKLQFPAIFGLTLNMGDIAEDDLGRRYIFSACELTDLGWNATAMQALA